MKKEDLEVGDVVEVIGYTDPQRVIGLFDRYATFKDVKNNITGSQTYENILDIITVTEQESDLKASEKQVAGNHYAKLRIQPMRYALENGLNYAQANAVKYITRYKDKNGIEDLKKAIHCIELLIQHEEGYL